MKYLIVVDMQVDFITGSLGSKTAEDIVLSVVKKVNNFDGKIIFTRDTHDENYLKTREGRMLPVKHCIKDTLGGRFGFTFGRENKRHNDNKNLSVCKYFSYIYREWYRFRF